MKPKLVFSSRFVRTLLPALAALAVLPAGVQGFPAPQWMQGGHSARISGVAGSPDGALIASASEDGTVKLWSTNGTLLRTLNTQPYPTTALAWSSDGTKIAAGTYYGGYVSTSRGIPGLTYLWQAPNGWTATVSLVRVLTNHFGKISTLAFSPDNLRLAAGCAEGSNVVRSVTDGSVVGARPAYNTAVGPAAVTSVAYSARGWMASGCEDSSVRVYDSSLNPLWSSTTAHSTNVTAVAFSPDGSLLATASLDQTVKIWTTNGWSLVRTITGHTNGIASVAFSPDGQELVSGGVDGTVKVWNRSDGVCLWTIVAHALPVTVTVFSDDGARVISGGDDGAIRLWSAADGAAVCTLGGQNSYIGTVAFSPDGTLCASTSGESIQVWNPSNGALVRALAGNSNYVSTLAFSPDSTKLASGGGPLDPTIKIWRIGDGALLQTIAATTNGVMVLAWSPDGSTLAAGGDSVERVITLWSTNGSLQRTLAGHTNGVTALAFSPRGDYLASGGRRPENMVRIWRLSDGIVTRSFNSTATNNNVECVTFSPDGNYVGYGRTAVNVLKVGNIATGTDYTLGSGTNPVYSVVYSPDGRTLAATYQNTVQIWTNGSAWNSWALYDTITNEAIRATGLAYSPNGNLFLCGREDGTLTMSPNLRGAMGQPPLTFISFQVDADGKAGLSAAVQPWTRYIVQSSSDLASWSYLTQAVSSTSVLSQTNQMPPTPAGFLRAVTPP